MRSRVASLEETSRGRHVWADRQDRRTLLRIRLRDVGLESTDPWIPAEVVNDRSATSSALQSGTCRQAECRASLAPHSVTAESLFGDLLYAGVMMTSLAIGVNPWDRKARRLRAFPGATAAKTCDPRGVICRAP